MQAIALLLLACAGREPAPATEPAAPPEEAAVPEPVAVDVVGTAQNAKMAAVVVLDDGSSHYVRGLDAWDDALVGQRVRVTGKLVTDPAPGSLVDEEGNWSAGPSGETSWIEDASWALTEPAP